MEIRLLSDLHNEFLRIDLPVMEDEKEQVLVLAGDIDLAHEGRPGERLVEFLTEMCKRFKKVLMVPGNHEFYKTRHDKALAFIYDETQDLENFVLFDDYAMEIEPGVTVVGATLWTDMDRLDTLVIAQAGWGMNDYRLIKYKDGGVFRKLSPNDTIKLHFKSKKFIFEQVAQAKEKGNKVLVVTHMGPSWQSIAEQFKGDNLNGAYVSNLEPEILFTKPDLWVHGHTHCSFDYTIGETRVVTNPRGYSKLNFAIQEEEVENKEFDPTMVIDL